MYAKVIKKALAVEAEDVRREQDFEAYKKKRKRGLGVKIEEKPFVIDSPHSPSLSPRSSRMLQKSPSDRTVNFTNATINEFNKTVSKSV